MKKIVIIDRREHDKHDVWQSEIRVDRDIAVGKLLKFFARPHPKTELAREVIRNEAVLRGNRKGSRRK